MSWIKEIELEDSEGQLAKFYDVLIKSRGKVSNIMWQHIQTYIETHPNMNYVDLEDGFQIITYSKEPISCSKNLEIVGKVIKVGGSKDPRLKISDGHCEYHVIAETWKCI